MKFVKEMEMCLKNSFNYQSMCKKYMFQTKCKNNKTF